MLAEINILSEKFLKLKSAVESLGIEVDYILEKAKLENKNPINISKTTNRKNLIFENSEIIGLIKLVCNHYGQDYNKLMSKDKHRELVYIRQILIYLLYKNTPYSTTDIGELFKRDHATVIYSSKIVKSYIDLYEKTHTDFDDYIKRLKDISELTNLPW